MKKKNIIRIIYFLFFLIITIFFIYVIKNIIIIKKEGFKLNTFPDENIIYCFWTGNNIMSDNRKKSLENLKSVSGCNVILVNPENLNKYILDEEPLHEAYQYLSETHKADYLRTYFMHFYGGGYSDIKCTPEDWTNAFNDIRNDTNCWINGAREKSIEHIGHKDAVKYFDKLVINSCYIVRPNTEFTKKWYSEMIELMDRKLDELRKHPATYPQETIKDGNGYPLEWIEMLGRIFHKVLLNYLPHVKYSVPYPIVTEEYR